MAGRAAVVGARPRRWGVGNELVIGASVLRRCSFDVVGDQNKIIIGDRCLLRNVKFFVRGSHNVIRIGNRALFGSHGSQIWVEDGHCTLSIGERCVIEGAHLAVTEPESQLTIGDDCLFSTDIDIRTGDSHPLFDVATGQRINAAASVSIGDRVWIGAHVSVLKGVTISADTVVGTRSVVTSSIATTNCVVAGHPARVVRENVSWGMFRDPHSLETGRRFRT